MEKIFKTLAVGTLWYAIFVFLTNQHNPMLWPIIAKIFAVIFGATIVNSNLRDLDY